MKKTRVMNKAWTVFISMLMVTTALNAGNEIKTDETTFPVEELKSRMWFLASDYLGGRATDEPGFTIAAEYVKTQFEAAGLLPFIETEAPEQSFFHTFTLKRKDYYTDTPLTIQTKNGETVYNYGEGFRVIRSFTGGMVDAGLETVFVGYGIEEPDEGWNDFEGLDVEGKNVVILYGAPVNKGEPVLSAEKHELYNSRKGLSVKLRHLMEKKPAAMMLVENEDLKSFFGKVPDNTRVFSNEYQGSDYRMNMIDYFYRLYIIKPELAEVLLEGSKIQFDKIMEGNLKHYKTKALTDIKVSIPIRVEEKEVVARNVIGMVEGTDSLLKNEYILIGGHLDHEPNFNGMVNNGADDNASGVVTVMELAQYFAEHPLKRSIIFAAWAAEEGGCYGSRNFVETIPGGSGQINVAMNFDCVGRNGRKAEERFQTYMLDAGTICPEIVPLVDRINEETVNFRIEKEMQPRWGTSDQESFINAGVPVVDFFNGGTEDLHRPTDDAEKIDFEYLQKICILGAAIAEELGNMDDRICEGNEL